MLVWKAMEEKRYTRAELQTAQEEMRLIGLK